MADNIALGQTVNKSYTQVGLGRVLVELSIVSNTLTLEHMNLSYSANGADYHISIPKSAITGVTNLATLKQFIIDKIVADAIA